MDKEIAKLLLAWNLEGYLDVFAKNNITLECLNLLDNNMIKELFPRIGDRAIFIKNLENYNSIAQSQQNQQTQDGTEENVTHVEILAKKQCDDCTDERVDMLSENHRDPFANLSILNNIQTEAETILFPRTSSLIASTSQVDSSLGQQSTSYNMLLSTDLVVNQKKKTLLELLKSSVEGRTLLKLHQEEGLLNSSSRRKLCNLIIKDLLGNDETTTIASAVLYDMASQIKEIFQKENISTYFIPYINNKNLKIKRCAKGKLYDCLHNRKREYRLAEKKLKNDTNSSSPNKTLKKLTDVEMGNVSEDIAWMLISTEPWKLLEEKWKNTTKYRQQEAEKMSVSKYMALYPGLKKPTGYHLLCIDFDNMYPEAVDNLYKNFMLSKQRILDLASTKFKSNASMNETVKSMIDNLAEQQHQDSGKIEEAENITAFLMLALLVGPPLVKKAKKHCWRPSKQECRDGFITHVVRQMDLQETITRTRNKYLSYGATLQPSIYIVGENLHNIEQYFVLVDNIFYTVKNIVQAVDVCFKLYQALHCEYPLVCETVWHFIQKGFYKITTSYDKEFVSVNSLLADLLLVDKNA